MAETRYGNPLTDPNLHMGPLMNQAGLDKVAALVDSARQQGAQVRTGGRVADRPGFHYEPTVLVGRLHGVGYPGANFDELVYLINVDKTDKQLTLPALAGRPLEAVEHIVCASPAYLAARGTPAAPDDLANHACLGFERTHADSLWPFVVEGAPRSIAVRPRFSANTARAVIDAALAGAGVVRVLSYQVAREIADGRLVEVLAPFRTEAFPVHLVYSGQPMLPLKLRAFLDFAAPRLKDRLPPA